MFRRMLVLLLSAGIALPGLTGCHHEEDCSIGGGCTLTAVCSGTFPPYNYKTANGEADGIEIALLGVVAKCLGRQLRIQTVPFAGMFPKLEEGAVHVAASGIAVTEERSRRMLFSTSYMAGTQVVVVSRISTFRGIEDLAGRSVGAEAGTTGEKAVADHGCKVMSFPNIAAVLSALQNGQVEAAVVGRRPAEFFVQRAQSLYLCPTALLRESYAFAFPLERRRLRDETNVILQAMHDSGLLQRIIARYEVATLNADPTRLPKVAFDPEAAAEELLENRQLKESLVRLAEGAR